MKLRGLKLSLRPQLSRDESGSNGWALCPAWFPKVSQAAKHNIYIAVQLAPADGMTHLDWAVLYSGMRACYIRLRSGWGSDGDVYDVLRGLGLLETKRGTTPNRWTKLASGCQV